MNSTLKKRFPFLPVILLSLLIAAVGVGCGGGGGGTPPPPPPDPNQDASGLYNATGTASFTLVKAGGTVSLNVTKGMISGNQFIFFNADISDPDSNILYDGEITSITLTDLVGTADVYQRGQIVASDVAVAGTVNSRSRVQLTFAATPGVVGSLAGDFSGGSVDGTFDMAEYDKGASQTTIDSQSNAEWGTGNNTDNNVYMKILGMTTQTFVVSRTDDTYRLGTFNVGNVNNCFQNGGQVAIPDAAVNIYTVGGDSITTTTIPSCPDLNGTSGYSGFAAVVDDAIDGQNNGIWYAVTNGTYSIFAILSRP